LESLGHIEQTIKDIVIGRPILSCGNWLESPESCSDDPSVAVLVSDGSFAVGAEHV
jgi:hypothetical protein